MAEPSGFGFLDILKLIGALGFFIYGMKVMSEGIQKVAGKKMRQILGAITSNRVSGVVTGFSITALIQSSSATTVMVVSFVNAGLLNLKQSIGVIMGANIGTTITAWLVSAFGFGKLDISSYSLPLIAIAFPLMFMGKNRLKSLAEFLIGFALLFLGLSALKDSIPDIKSSDIGFVQDLVSDYGDLDTTSIKIVDYPTNGELELDEATGTFTYAFDPTQAGKDQYTYSFCHVNGEKTVCDTAVVTIKTARSDTPPKDYVKKKRGGLLPVSDQGKIGDFVSEQGSNMVLYSHGPTENRIDSLPIATGESAVRIPQKWSMVNVSVFALSAEQDLSYMRILLLTLIFVLIGTIMTVIVQSSSAAMTLTLALLFKDVITFEMAAAMVLGENIGTTITANLAALIANVHAKRAARAHTIFNMFGVLWIIPIMPFFADGVNMIWNWMVTAISDLDPTNNQMKLALFHTTFNLINTGLLIWFVPQIANIVIRLVPVKNEEDQQFHLDYIGGGVLGTPELSLVEARKEVAKFGQITHKMHGFMCDLLAAKDEKAIKKLYERIEKYETITDRVEEEVVQYLLKVAQGGLSQTASTQVRTMLSIVDDLEDIGDIYFSMAMNFKRKRDEKAWFTPEQRNNLKGLMDKVDDAFNEMVTNLDQAYDNVDISKAYEKEDAINKLRDKMRKTHLRSIENQDYNIRSGMIYTDFYNSAEKVGDQIMSVNQAIVGKV